MLCRSETCTQIALAIKDEVEDLETAGVTVIQIDEAVKVCLCARQNKLATRIGLCMVSASPLVG